MVTVTTRRHEWKKKERDSDEERGRERSSLKWPDDDEEVNRMCSISYIYVHINIFLVAQFIHEFSSFLCSYFLDIVFAILRLCLWEDACIRAYAVCRENIVNEIDRSIAVYRYVFINYSMNLFFMLMKWELMTSGTANLLAISWSFIIHFNKK